jgi:RNA-directed DNA polymerase
MIESVHQLADLLETELFTLEELAENAPKHYRRFGLKKKTGGYRRIYVPDVVLKSTQRRVLKNILEQIPVHPAATAYRPGLSILDNARMHESAEFLVYLDMADFFESVRTKMVRRIFRKIATNPVSSILTAICTRSGGLPQGAPTSPALANIAARDLDDMNEYIAGRMRSGYSRYADDMVFSCESSREATEIMKTAVRNIGLAGFNLNYKKTRILGPGRRKVVTGLTIGRTGAGIGRRKERQIRAAIHSLESGDYRKYGHINGLLRWVRHVDPIRWKRLGAQFEKTTKVSFQ